MDEERINDNIDKEKMYEKALKVVEELSKQIMTLAGAVLVGAVVTKEFFESAKSQFFLYTSWFFLSVTILLGIVILMQMANNISLGKFDPYETRLRAISIAQVSRIGIPHPFDYFHRPAS